MSDIKEIVFQNIDENYGYGKYGDFEIIMNINTGSINATKLCKDGGKEFSEWKRFNHSKKFIDYLGSLGYPKDLIIQITNVPNHLKGTYVHPDLIPHIASWVSPEFAYKVSKIVNEHIIKEYRNTIRQKDDKIDNLEKIIQEIREEQKQTLKEISDKSDKILDENKKVNHKLDVANENIIVSISTLKQVSQQRVPMEKVPKQEIPELLIFYTDEKEEKPYRIHRTQNKRSKFITKELREEFPNLRKILHFGKQPNPIESWNRCKKDLRNYMIWNGSQFSLNGITEKEFIERVNQIVQDTKMEPYEEVKEQFQQDLEEKINEVNNDNVEKIENLEVRETRRRELFLMKVVELKNFCKEQKLKGYSKMKKEELVELILDN